MAENKTIHKLFWVWEFEKEEGWLNEMAAEGWALKSAKWFTFVFEKTDPAEFIIRLDYCDSGSKDEYVSFVEETGAEYVGHCGHWMYFRRRSELGTFEMLSDIDSGIQLLKRVGKLLFIVAIANIITGIIQTISTSRWGILNLFVASLLTYALGRIHGRKEVLENERRLIE